MIICGDAAVWLKHLVEGCIDLTVTSPPYDNLRTYGGYTFNFEAIAKELYRITKQGGIVVWIVGDQTIDGSETLTSFKQALHFKDVGFKLHDTMIYSKQGFAFPESNRYHPTFEYMFILSKGKPKTFNPISDRINTDYGKMKYKHQRAEDGSLRYNGKSFRINNRYGMRYNVWEYGTGGNGRGNDPAGYDHPASFPYPLVVDHIKSWSNEGDLILDPFAGSGTTLKAAHQLNRKWIGIEINPEYVQLAKKRLTPYIEQQRMEKFLNI